MIIRKLILVTCFFVLISSCVRGNHTLTSVCYKEKYHTLLLDGERTVKRIVDDECYKKEEVLRWKWHKQF